MSFLSTVSPSSGAVTKALDKVGIRLRASGALPTGHAFIEVFHDWIRRRELDELMIDVSDYSHVRGGPSVYFCGHASDYAVHLDGDAPGIAYRRKRAGDSFDPLGDGLARLAKVVTKLSSEAKLRGVAFDGQTLEIAAFDRLNAPNTADAAKALEAAIRASLEKKLGAMQFEHASVGDPRAPLTLRAKLDRALDLAALAG